MKEKIQELERQIAALPIGYISKKTINGKTRYYHQWTENGKKHSQYLRDGELEPLQEQIEQRKVLQAQLKELQAKMPKVRQPKLDFETSVIVGKGLDAMSQGCLLYTSLSKTRLLTGTCRMSSHSNQVREMRKRSLFLWY